MSRKLLVGFVIFQILLVSNIYGQGSKITEQAEEKTYKYFSYHESGQVEKEVGFYAKKPYNSIEEFESELKKYKVKEHGPTKIFYSNGQLKEIVVYKKGKVIEYMKNYFEDGEEYSVGNISLPEFQFEQSKQNLWLAKKIQDVENKYNIDLEGNGLIALDISKDGVIKSIKVRIMNEDHEKYLIEIGEQLKVMKPATKDGENIGTRYAFKLQM